MFKAKHLGTVVLWTSSVNLVVGLVAFHKKIVIEKKHLYN